MIPSLDFGINQILKVLLIIKIHPIKTHSGALLALIKFTVRELYL